MKQRSGSTRWESLGKQLGAFRRAVAGAIHHRVDSSQEGVDPAAEQALAPLNQLLGKLPALETEVRAILAGLEKNFLEIGSSLDVLPSESQNLVQHTKRLLTLASGQEGGEDLLTGTLNFVREPLDFLSHCSERREDLVIQLQKASAEISNILRSEEELKHTISPLNYLQTNFRIESAGLEISLQQMFLALVGEINRLNGQVQEMFAARFEQLRQVRKTIENLITSQRLQNEKEQTILVAKRKEIKETLARLREEVQSQAQKDHALNGISAEIARGVQQLVFGLQSHDILSQKLLHTTEALARLPSRPSLKRSEGIQGVEEEIARIAPVTQLQSAQLRSVNQEFVTAHTKLSEAAEQIIAKVGDAEKGCTASAEALSIARIPPVARMGSSQLREAGKEFNKVHRQISNVSSGLLADVDRAAREFTELPGLATVTAGADGLVQLLLNEIADIRLLIDQAVEGIGRYYEAIKPLGGLASNIKDTIRDLSANIHLIALNSQIKASQVSNGLALEVLAGQTAMIAEQTAEISRRLADDLDTISMGLDRFVGEFKELAVRGGEFHELMREKGGGHEAALHEYRDQALRELTAAHQSSEKIRDCAENIRACLLRDADVPDRIACQIEILDQTGREADTFIRDHAPHLAGRVDESIAELLKSYTMASEREIHLQVVNARTAQPESRSDIPSAQPSAEPHQDQPQATPAPGGGTLGDNVELF